MGLIDFENNPPPKPWSREFSVGFAGMLAASEALEIEKRATQEIGRLRVTIGGAAQRPEDEFGLALSFQGFLLHVVHRLLAESWSHPEADRIARSMASTMAELGEPLWTEPGGESATDIFLDAYTRGAKRWRGFR